MNVKTATHTAAAFNALNAFGLTVKGAAEKLRAAFEVLGIVTVEQTFEVVTAWAAKRSGCPLVQSQRGSKIVLDSKHAAYEAAKTARRRVMDVFDPAEKAEKTGKASGHQAVKITPTLRKAALSFSRQFDGKDEKAQIRAAIAALRSLI